MLSQLLPVIEGMLLTNIIIANNSFFIVQSHTCNLLSLAFHTVNKPHLERKPRKSLTHNTPSKRGQENKPSLTAELN